jgi:hypothetical protein
MRNLREGEDRMEQGNWGTFATREVPTFHQMDSENRRKAVLFTAIN